VALTRRQDARPRLASFGGNRLPFAFRKLPRSGAPTPARDPGAVSDAQGSSSSPSASAAEFLGH